MDFLLDSHTHTLASGHAYCTLLEMAQSAADRGLSLMCVTDHAPGMPHTTHREYFLNMRTIDRTLFGVELMMGVELNAMDFEGTLDLEDSLLSALDMGIVSLHPQCMPKGGTAEAYTHTLITAMASPWVNIIGHPDDGTYPLDYATLVRAAGERGVLLEVNNSSLAPDSYRQNAHANCTELLRQCRAQDVPVVVGSDAHFISGVGAHQYALALLEELHFPSELVINSSPQRFRDVIAKKRATGR